MISRLRTGIDNSTKYFMNVLCTRKAHLYNLSTLVVVNIMIMGLGFFANVKIANVMGKEGFGRLSYALALGMCGATVVQFGFNKTLVRDLVHAPAMSGTLLCGSLIVRGAILFFLLMVLAFWNFLLPPGGHLSLGMLIVVIATALKSLDFQPIYDSWHKMQRHSVYKLLQQSLYFISIGVVALFYSRLLTVTLIGISLLISVLLYLAVQAKWAVERIDFSSTRGEILWTALDLGKNNFWILLASMGCLSFGYLNQLILKHYGGDSELGVYSAAWQFVIVAMLLLLQVARIGNPLMAKVTCGDVDKVIRVRFLIKYSALMFTVAIVISLPVLIIPGIVLQFVFQPEYASAAEILRIMGIYVMIFSLGVVASQYVISVSMEKIYFASVAVGASLSVILCFVLIPRWLGVGTALSLLISHGTCMGLYWVAMIKHVRS